MVGGATVMVFAELTPIFNKNISLCFAGLLLFTLLSIFLAYLWDKSGRP
jgi:hypothetical protein